MSKFCDTSMHLTNPLSNNAFKFLCIPEKHIYNMMTTFIAQSNSLCTKFLKNTSKPRPNFKKPVNFNLLKHLMYCCSNLYVMQ